MGDEEDDIDDIVDALEIRIENVSGDLLTNVSVPGSFSCVELNQKLLDLAPLPNQKEYKFMFEGKTLKSGLTLLEQGMYENATLSAVTQRRKGGSSSTKSGKVEKSATWDGAEEKQGSAIASFEISKTASASPIPSKKVKLAHTLDAPSISIECPDEKDGSEPIKKGRTRHKVQKMGVLDAKASEIMQQVLRDGHEYMVRRLQERLGVEMVIDKQVDAKLNEVLEDSNWNTEKKEEKKHPDSGSGEVAKKHLLVPRKQNERRGSDVSRESPRPPKKRGSATSGGSPQPAILERAVSHWKSVSNRYRSSALDPTKSEAVGDEKNDVGRRVTIFPDQGKMKNKLKEALGSEAYNVANYYHEEGIFQEIARHPYFEQFTLLVIGINAIWIAIDTDYNKADVLVNAEPQFVIMENLFCIFFFAEWLIRVLAFKDKRSGFQDRWFLFDTALLMMMVVETWVMALVFLCVRGSQGSFKIVNTGVLKLLKLLRLTRMARIFRLLRAMPEILILLRAMFVAFRSVFFTLCLLMVIIYAFAIALVLITREEDENCRRLQHDAQWDSWRRLSQDNECVHKKYFETVSEATFSLLFAGNLPDHERFAYEVWDSSWFAGLIAILFIILAPLTVMGMLAGVLVEVVKVVSSVEKEAMDVDYVKDKLLFALKECDFDESGMISRDEFEDLLPRPDIVRMLNSVDVDVVGIAEFVDYIFDNQEEIPHAAFMELVLQLRGSNTATVKDLVDLRKYARSDSMATHEQLNALSDKIDANEKAIRSLKTFMTFRKAEQDSARGGKHNDRVLGPTETNSKDPHYDSAHESIRVQAKDDILPEVILPIQEDVSVADSGAHASPQHGKKKKKKHRDLLEEEATVSEFDNS